MIKIYYAFFGCAAIFAIYAIALLIDGSAFNYRYYNKLMYKPSCNYTVPNEYKIVYCDDKGKYAVRVLCDKDYFLYNQISRITPMYSTIAMPALFDDSCEAKGYLRAYIKDTQPRISCAD